MNVIVRSMINGFTVIWDKVDNAARYIVRLYVKDFTVNPEYRRPGYGSSFDTVAGVVLNSTKEIDVVEIERSKSYISFVNMAELSIIRYGQYYSISGFDSAMNYYVKIEAENKNGDLIETSKETVCLIKIPRNGENGIYYADEVKWGGN